MTKRNIMHFKDRLCNSTFKISGNYSSGTCFVFKYNFSESHSKLFLVTNRHVVEQNSSAHMNFYISDQPYPNSIKSHGFKNTLDIPEAYWRANWIFPDDVSIDLAILDFDKILGYMNNTRKIYYYFECISNNDFIPENILNSLTHIENVIYAGFPYGWTSHDDILPISGSGVTATSLKKNHNNSPIFLIDANIYKGSSGCPVFIERKNVENGELSEQYYFVGINFANAGFINNDVEIDTYLVKCIHAKELENLILLKFPSN